MQYISGRTFRDYEGYIKSLSKLFGSLRLREIQLQDIDRYQRCRAAGRGFFRIIGNKKGREPVPSPAGVTRINSELRVLKKLMRMAGCWTPQFDACYRPMRRMYEPEIERALSPVQQEGYLEVAASNPEWWPLWWYSLIAPDTTFSSDEMRTLRIGDVHLIHRQVSVNLRYGKNNYRRRTVMLHDPDCDFAFERLIEHARGLGSTALNHHLFPFCEHSNGRVATYDPTRPMGETGLRKIHLAVRAKAGVPWFCLNGWRHTAITRLAEDGVPIAIIMKRSGHLTERMSRHYTHISDAVAQARLSQVPVRRSTIPAHVYAGLHPDRGEGVPF